MSQANSGGTKSFLSSAALGHHLRVKISSGKLALAGLGANDGLFELGTLRDAATEADQPSTVLLRNRGGSQKMIASGAIGQGVEVYGAANGQVSVTASGSAIGISLSVASAANDVIEVMYY